jgi:hypothetical protein
MESDNELTRVVLEETFNDRTSERVSADIES